ncbi:SDR family NAD(P)-dependent oxidoreductase [Corallococcus exiguus]|uniref:SDR family oxidoreductase n=2 Tax=Corallococcus exiguus TaxID=83462 RepID=A0A7X5BWC1_9BACT|nr:SDR family oxidoreductase [Corallococcus exiguus]NBC46365.1 SDR family oxidoreductase [Corallococcus exiguus]TNV49957.1 SDR family oxidoreductase [Corallococcus exiguus]
MGRLTGKVALVTGSNGGIGFATARLFAEEGAHVYVNGRRREQVEVAVRRIGPNATPLPGDVSRAEDLRRMFEHIKRERKALDIVVANAAISRGAALGGIDERTYQEVFDVNVKGVIFTVQGALPLMADGGSVLLMGSVITGKGIPGETLYAASKATIRSLARTWAAELAPRRIRVNVVTPGAIHTEGMEAALGGSEATAQRLDAMAQAIPVGRVGEPEDLARALLFMASSDAAYVNGTELYVDGGRTQV